MISKAMKITYKRTHRSRQTSTKGREAFSERVGVYSLREINLRANILREFVKNHVRPKELSTEAINSST